MCWKECCSAVDTVQVICSFFNPNEELALVQKLFNRLRVNFDIKLCNTINYYLMYKYNLKNVNSVEWDKTILSLQMTTVQLIYEVEEESYLKSLFGLYWKIDKFTNNAEIFVDLLNNLNDTKLFLFLEIFQSDDIKYFKDIFNTLINFLFNDSINESFVRQILLIYCCFFNHQDNCKNETQLIDTIWCQAKEAFKSKICSNERLCLILCVFSKYYYNDNYQFYIDDTFWDIVQCGLSSHSINQRTYSMRILNQFISYINSSERVFHVSRISDVIDINKELQSSLKALWIVLSSLEETQVHIVLVTLETSFKSLYKEINDDCLLHPSWFIIMFKRILCHESTTIIKWGLMNLLNVINVRISDDFTDLFPLLYRALDNMILYNSIKNENPEIVKVLYNWFEKMSKNENKLFFKYFLSELVKHSWSPIPLFYVINSLSYVSSCSAWNEESLLYLKKLINETLITQSKFIRGAIQCKLITTLTKLTFLESSNLSHLANILGCFRSSESLKYGMYSWMECVNYLNRLISSDIIDEFLINLKDVIKLKDNTTKQRQISAFNLKSGAVMLLLLNDTDLLKHNNYFNNFFEDLTNYFNFCDKRLYSETSIQDRIIKFLSFLFEEVKDSKENLKFIYSDFSSLLAATITYVEVKLIRCTNYDYYEVNNFIKYFHVISMNNYFENISPELMDVLEKLFEKSIELLGIEESTLIVKYFALNILIKFFVLQNSESKYLKRLVNLQKWIKKYFQDNFLTVDNNMNLNKILNFERGDKQSKFTGKMISSCVECSWQLFYYCVNVQNSNLNFKVLIEMAIEHLHIGGRDSVIHILTGLEVISIQLPIESLQKLLANSLVYCFELRKSEMFWKAINQWICMAFQEHLLIDLSYLPFIEKYTDKLLMTAADVTGLFCLIIEQLEIVCAKSQAGDQLYTNFLVNLLVDGIVFGPVPRKDNICELETCLYIKNLGQTCTVNELLLPDNGRNNYLQRIKALNIVLKCKTPSLVINVMEELLERSKKIVESSPKYFKDSYQHRVENRIFQSILILETFYFENYSNSALSDQPIVKSIFEWALYRLQNESQQASIRYQLEWLFIRLLIHYPKYFDRFWPLFSEVPLNRVGSICSFISIAYHLTKLRYKDENLFKKCLENILPWCMSQNFNTRLYAQVLLRDLWPLNRTISQQYDILWLNSSVIYSQGNVEINLTKLKNNFYFKIFDPVQHFQFEVIFWDLPRLSKISIHEWIPVSVLADVISDTITSIIPIYNFNTLKSCKETSWDIKGPGEDCDVDVLGLQKKFIPSIEILDNLNSSKKKQKTGLILVASLLDKIANIGGLARSCDIFGIQELIVTNLSLIKNKNFSSLSMTAEKHIRITEVKSYLLFDYLLKMKNKGYRLVGAEQTSNSQLLSEFTFPENSILLLGNEREGIPPDLLPLLDFCVEIPQYGILRSLNVHVTGALFMWEYSKQHFT